MDFTRYENDSEYSEEVVITSEEENSEEENSEEENSEEENSEVTFEVVVDYSGQLDSINTHLRACNVLLITLLVSLGIYVLYRYFVGLIK